MSIDQQSAERSLGINHRQDNTLNSRFINPGSFNLAFPTPSFTHGWFEHEASGGTSLLSGPQLGQYFKSNATFRNTESTYQMQNEIPHQIRTQFQAD